MTYAPALDSANHIPWAQAVGYAGGLRYLSSFPAKNLTQQEFSEARTAGKSLALVFEDQAQDALGGAVMGRLKAAKAASQTRWLLWPVDRPVYFSCDFEATPDQYPIMWACVSAFAGALKRPTAVYAQRGFLRYAENRGCRFLWELGSESFNEGAEPKYKSLQQHPDQVYIAGVECDYNDVLVEDWGQNPAPVKPKPPKKPKHPKPPKPPKKPKPPKPPHPVPYKPPWWWPFKWPFGRPKGAS